MPDLQTTAPQPTILIVDDKPGNLRVLSSMLNQAGYLVHSARSGEAALESAHLNSPDLILLDIIMPHMDGYQVCHQLKASKQTQNIPVIFISGLDKPLDKIKSFSSGGVDYITKPFHVDEVLARVKTHITIRTLQKDLLDQIAELDAFAHTVAHDLKNPLSLVTGFADHLVTFGPEMSQEERQKMLGKIQQAGHKAINIIDELLLLASVYKQQVPLEVVDMAEIVAQAQDRLGHLIEKYQGTIIKPQVWPAARGYAPWLEEVWVNYLSNGLKYGTSPSRLELGATHQADNTIQFWVKDNGKGLTIEEQAFLFTEFVRLDKARARGHGLGLSIVRRIIEKLGGQAGVESQLDQGSKFYFTLLPADN